MNMFKPKKFTKTYPLRINSAPETVFPLLCPEREREWIPDWEYEMVYSDSGFNEKNCVFKNSSAFGVETLWVNAKYDPINYESIFIQFIRDMMTASFSVTCRKNGNSTTDIEIEYTFITLSEEGNKMLDLLVANHLDMRVMGLETLLNQYLAQN